MDDEDEAKHPVRNERFHDNHQDLFDEVEEQAVGGLGNSQSRSYHRSKKSKSRMPSRDSEESDHQEKPANSFKNKSRAGGDGTVDRGRSPIGSAIPSQKERRDKSFKKDKTNKSLRSGVSGISKGYIDDGEAQSREATRKKLKEDLKKVEKRKKEYKKRLEDIN